MIKIENFLSKEDSEFLNYKFEHEKTYFVNMKNDEINYFWSFLTENKNYVLGDMIVSNVLVTDQNNKNRISIIERDTFFVDDGLWFNKQLPAIQLLKKLAYFKNSYKKYNSYLKELLGFFEISFKEIEKPYELLNNYVKTILNIILMIIVDKRYNFLLVPNWNKLNEYEQKKILNKIDSVIKYTVQSFIFVIEQTDESKLDINNPNYTKTSEITINNVVFEKIYKRKRNSLKTFNNLSKMILSIFKIPYIICMTIIFLALFLMMFVIYTSNHIVNYEQSKIIIWVFIAITLSALLAFVLWCIPYFRIYKNFIKTIPIANASKITYFCYVNLILITTIQLLANFFPWLISISYTNFSIETIYITFCIFINIGFLIINLVLLALWILLYNKK